MNKILIHYSTKLTFFMFFKALVVESHDADPQTMKRFRKIILLIRDPGMAILAKLKKEQGQNQLEHLDPLTINTSESKSK